MQPSVVGRPRNTNRPLESVSMLCWYDRGSCVSNDQNETVAPGYVPWGFAEVFVISQTALPALLYLPGSQAFRLPIRFSAFAISLAAFGWYQIESTTQAPRSQMQGWVAAVMETESPSQPRPAPRCRAGWPP